MECAKSLYSRIVDFLNEQDVENPRRTLSLNAALTEAMGLSIEVEKGNCELVLL